MKLPPSGQPDAIQSNEKTPGHPVGTRDRNRHRVSHHEIDGPASSGHDAGSSSPDGGASSNLRTRPSSQDVSRRQAHHREDGVLPAKSCRPDGVGRRQLECSGIHRVPDGGRGTGRGRDRRDDGRSRETGSERRPPLSALQCLDQPLGGDRSRWCVGGRHATQRQEFETTDDRLGDRGNLPVRPRQGPAPAIRNQGSADKQSALYAFLNQAAAEDPEEAFRVLASESSISQSYSHYQTLFQKWAKDDPEAAIANLNLIKGTSNRQQALQGVVVALVTSDPQRALGLLDGMPPGQSRTNMLVFDHLHMDEPRQRRRHRMDQQPAPGR